MGISKIFSPFHVYSDENAAVRFVDEPPENMDAYLLLKEKVIRAKRKAGTQILQRELPIKIYDFKPLVTPQTYPLKKSKKG